MIVLVWVDAREDVLRISIVGMDNVLLLGNTGKAEGTGLNRLTSRSKIWNFLPWLLSACSKHQAFTA